MAIAFVPALTNVNNTNIAIAQTNRQQKPNNRKPKSSNRQSQPVKKIKRWIRSIWQRKPKKTLGARSGICSIAPGLVEARIIWHDKPLFLWHSILQNQEARLIVRERHSQKSLWMQKVNLNDKKAFYKGQPLKPDKLYQWKLEGTTSSTPWTTFQIVTASQRAQIQADLQALKQKTRDITSQEIALRKAEYFLNYSVTPLSKNHLWADGLQALYQVEKPSPSFVQKREAFVRNICTPDEE